MSDGVSVPEPPRVEAVDQMEMEQRAAQIVDTASNDSEQEELSAQV